MWNYIIIWQDEQPPTFLIIILTLDDQDNGSKYRENTHQRQNFHLMLHAMCSHSTVKDINEAPSSEEKQRMTSKREEYSEKLTCNQSFMNTNRQIREGHHSITNYPLINVKFVQQAFRYVSWWSIIMRTCFYREEISRKKLALRLRHIAHPVSQ